MASYHLLADTNCSLYKYGVFLKTLNAEEYEVIQLNRGTHKLSFISDIYPNIRKDVIIEVPDDTYEGYIEIRLLEKELANDSTSISKADMNNTVKDSIGNCYSQDWRRLLKGKRATKVLSIDSRCKIICDSAFYDESAAIYSFGMGMNLGAYVIDLTLPEGIRMIGKQSFRSSKQMKTIHLPNSISYIGESAFWDCEDLESVVIPSQVKVIAPKTFGFCGSLQTVVISEGVERIENWAFGYCKSLKKIVLPRTIEYIAQDAFEDCSSLQTIIVPKGEKRRISRLLSFGYLKCLSLVQESIKIPLAPGV